MPSVNSCDRAAFRSGINEIVRRVVRHRPEVELRDERSGTAAARLPVAARDRRPVERIEGVVVVDPVVAAEHDAADRQLHQVVEHAPAAIDFPLAVALDVVGKADARRDLVAEVELDAGIVRPIRRHVLGLGANAEVQRQLAVERPRILDEESEVVRLDITDGHEADDVVVAVLALDAAAVVERVGLVPEQLNRCCLFARERVVDDALDLQAALEGVLAVPVAVARDVGVEVEAAEAAAHELRARGVVGKAAHLLQVRRNLRIRTARRPWRCGRVADVRRVLEHVAQRVLNVPSSC